MNKNRRARLSEVQNVLEGALADLEEIISEEEEAVDMIPENLQSSQRYEEMTDNLDTMNDAQSDIESAISYIEEVISK